MARKEVLVMYVSHFDSAPVSFHDIEIFQDPSDIFLRGCELEEKAMKQKVIDLESGVVEQIDYENGSPVLFTQKYRELYLDLDVVQNRSFLLYDGKKNTGAMDLAYIQRCLPKLMTKQEREWVLQKVHCLQPHDLNLSLYFDSIRKTYSQSNKENSWLTLQLLPYLQEQLESDASSCILLVQTLRKMKQDEEKSFDLSDAFLHCPEIYAKALDTMSFMLKVPLSQLVPSAYDYDR